MEFKEAVKICLTKKYCCFKGRASRSEFWWLCLFTFILNLVVALLGSLLPALGSIVSAVQALWLLLPTVGVTPADCMTATFRAGGRCCRWQRCCLP